MRALILLCLVLASVSAYSQFDPNYKYKKTNDYQPDDSASPLNVGLGMGLSYGGFGGRLSYFPQKNIGVFGAVGFNLHKAGYNGGLVVRIMPDKKICPVAMAMYGYNAVIVVVGASQYNKTYYGPTIGGGMELRLGNNGNYMNFELLVPFRSSEYHDDMQNLMSNPTIDISEALPIGIGIGYHFRIN